jgi:DNA (cytosine-5)-methyltransferase 1
MRVSDYMKLRVFEAFSGVGSQRMALRNLGIDHEVVAISEIDKYALQSYEAIHGDCPNLGDISKLAINDIPDHDLFTYSFPCQDISAIGKQGGLSYGSGTRSSLLWECQRVIEGKKPKYLLLENVKNLIGKNHLGNFTNWLGYLESLGYKNYYKVIKGTDCNIPQSRPRLFVVSILGDIEFSFNEKELLTVTLRDLLESNVGQEYYQIYHDFFIENSLKQELNGNGFRYKPHNPSHAKIAFTLTTKCGSRMDDNFVFDEDVSDDPYFTFNKENLEKYKGTKCRKLTPLECWRLMGFTDEDFYKARLVGVSDAQLYKQAGNSIIVDVLEGIFAQLFLKEDGVK